MIHVKEKANVKTLRRCFVTVGSYTFPNSPVLVNYQNSFGFLALAVKYMSLVVRKLAFCICENKDADQLRGDREADQRLCFRYTDRKISGL